MEKSAVPDVWTVDRILLGGAPAAVERLNSFARREHDLLEANNRYLERARSAERNLAMLKAIPASAASPAVKGTHPLEAYADSYAQMSRDGDGKVDCRSVEVDIRQNMIPVTRAPYAALPLAVKELDDWTEEDGDVLWWKFPITEAPYVGSPLDTGFTVEAHTTTRLITQIDQEHDAEPQVERINVGGWPGYHTHWTRISVPGLTSPAEPAPASHPDDIAVDRFAAAMKAKLAQKRTEGRRGWDNPDECSAAFLSLLLVEHIDKGDPLDVGNLAMMLHQRGERVADERERYAEQVRRRPAPAPTGAGK